MYTRCLLLCEVTLPGIVVGKTFTLKIVICSITKIHYVALKTTYNNFNLLTSKVIGVSKEIINRPGVAGVVLQSPP